MRFVLTLFFMMSPYVAICRDASTLGTIGNIRTVLRFA